MPNSRFPSAQARRAVHEAGERMDAKLLEESWRKLTRSHKLLRETAGKVENALRV